MLPPVGTALSLRLLTSIVATAWHPGARLTLRNAGTNLAAMVVCRWWWRRAGEGYQHVITVDDIRRRVAKLPEQYRSKLEVVQLSRMTRKRRLFPCYGLQWGTAVYLYPIEASLEELYVRAPRPAQKIETEMFGGQWEQDGGLWRLTWTEDTIRDYYLNNVLIHEIGHINDDRNTSFRERERFADWFAVEYGYRATHRTARRHSGQR